MIKKAIKDARPRVPTPDGADQTEGAIASIQPVKRSVQDFLRFLAISFSLVAIFFCLL